MLFDISDVERLRRKGNLPRLVKVMRRASNMWVRQAAATAIGELGDSSVVPELCAALERERTDELREALAAALAHTADEETLPLLLELTRKEICVIAAEAARGVARLDAAGTEVSAATMIEIVQDRLGAHWCAIECTRLVHATLDERAFAVIRRRATSEDVPALVELLNRADGGKATSSPREIEDWFVRRNVVSVLAKLKDRRAIVPLMARLPLEILDLHRDIFVAVASFGDPSVTDALASELVRAESLPGGIVEEYFASELDALIALAPLDLDDQLAELTVCAKSMAKVQMIMRHMRDADKIAQAKAARERAEFAELARRQDRDGVFRLIGLVWAAGDRADPAADALARVGITDIDAYLLAALNVSAAWAGALDSVEGHPAALTALTRIVADSTLDYHWRANIARALGEIGDRRAVPALCSALTSYRGLESDYVTQKAALALRDIGDPAALEPLRAVHRPNLVGHRMSDDDYVNVAVRAAESVDEAIRVLEQKTS